MILVARDLRKNETHAEQILWASLRNNNFHGLKFRRQHPINNYVLDFFCVEYQLALEVDGGIHKGHEQRTADLERDKSLMGLGMQVMRFTNDEILNDLPKVILKIHEKVRELQGLNKLAITHPSPEYIQERDRG